MTREEILAQAKVGAFAVVRMLIKELEQHESYASPLVVCGQHDYYGLVVPCDNVLSIEPPPKTDAERIVEIEAENERLKTALGATTKAFQIADDKLQRLRVEVAFG